jgi:16S rRNA (guanine527-N7)-methyltransferase
LPESDHPLNDDPPAADGGDDNVVDADNAGGLESFDAAGYRRELADAMEEAFAGIVLPPEQRDALLDFGALLAEKARLFNLTRLTAPKDMAIQHFLDSHHLARIVDPKLTTVLDIGTGAGVPGIPLAVMRPELMVTLIDGTGKKARFVREAVAALGLENARALQARAEEHLRRNRYHAAVMRAAVKPPRMMEILAETRRPLKAVIFMLGSDGADVARSLEAAPYKLTALETYRLPGMRNDRTIAVFEK